MIPAWFYSSSSKDRSFSVAIGILPKRATQIPPARGTRLDHWCSGPLFWGNKIAQESWPPLPPWWIWIHDQLGFCESHLLMFGVVPKGHTLLQLLRVLLRLLVRREQKSDCNISTIPLRNYKGWFAAHRKDHTSLLQLVFVALWNSSTFQVDIALSLSFLFPVTPQFDSGIPPDNPKSQRAQSHTMDTNSNKPRKRPFFCVTPVLTIIRLPSRINNAA